MRNQIDARGQNAVARVPQRVRAAGQGRQAQIESIEAIDAAAGQAIASLGDILHVIERAFVDQ